MNEEVYLLNMINHFSLYVTTTGMYRIEFWEMRITYIRTESIPLEKEKREHMKTANNIIRTYVRITIYESS